MSMAMIVTRMIFAIYAAIFANKQRIVVDAVEYGGTLKLTGNQLQPQTAFKSDGYTYRGVCVNAGAALSARS